MTAVRPPLTERLLPVRSAGAHRLQPHATLAADQHGTGAGAALQRLQAAAGNAAVAGLLRRVSGAGTVQRYSVPLAPTATCEQLLSYLGTRCPYAPAAAARTKASFTWTGTYAVKGTRPDYEVTVTDPHVKVSVSVDMPSWKPTGAMAGPWARAYATLRAHEAEHEQAAAQWRDRMEANLDGLSFTVTARSAKEARAIASGQAGAAFRGWIADHARDQRALDPFTTDLECPD